MNIKIRIQDIDNNSKGFHIDTGTIDARVHKGLIQDIDSEIINGTVQIPLNVKQHFGIYSFEFFDTNRAVNMLVTYTYTGGRNCIQTE